SAAAYEVGRNLKSQYEKKKNEAVVAKEYATGIEKAINSKNKEEAIAQLKKQQEYIKGVMAPDVNKLDELSDLRVREGKKRDEANKQFNELNQLRREAADVNNQLTNLNNQLS